MFGQLNKSITNVFERVKRRLWHQKCLNVGNLAINTDNFFKSRRQVVRISFQQVHMLTAFLFCRYRSTVPVYQHH